MISTTDKPPLLERMQTVRSAAYIKRFHTVPTVGDSQTVSAHSWGVATLLNEVWPDASKQLILATLYHDVAEILIGDVPSTSKWNFPEFAEALQKAEKKAEQMLGLQFALSEIEERQLKICDMLELLMFSAEQIKLGNHYFDPVYVNAYKYLHVKFLGTLEFDRVKPVIQWIESTRQKLKGV